MAALYAADLYCDNVRPDRLAGYPKADLPKKTGISLDMLDSKHDV